MHGDNDTVQPKPKVDESDKRLSNWSKWQEEWKTVGEAITQKLNSQPGDLVMNYSEGICLIKSEKKALEYARIPTEFDKYRGKPDFYKLPYSLPQRVTCCTERANVRCCCRSDCMCKNEPTYFAVKTKQESYIVPSVPLVGIPKHISEEKNIRNGTRNMYLKWRDSEYREQQMNILSEKIANIVPHWPQFDDLIVVGTKITTYQTNEEEEIHHVSEDEEPKEHVDAPQDEKQASRVHLVDSVIYTRPRLSLEVNGLTLTENCRTAGRRKLRLFFEYDITSVERGVNYVYFWNKGSATVRISWTKMDKFRIFRNFTGEKCDNHGFYFDKRELIILPGERFELPIWFKTENLGSYSESWEFVTAPRIWSEQMQIILVLQSYAYYKDLNEKVDTIVKYIETHARNLLIKDILHDILAQAHYVDKPVVPCVFGEADLFEVANLFDGRPLFLYNRELVDELIQIYDIVKSDEINWDYSIPHLKKIVHVKDTNTYLENKFAQLKEEISRIENAKTVPVLKEKSSVLDKNKKSKEKSSKVSKKGKKLKAEKSESKSSAKIEQSQSGAVEIVTEPFVYSSQLELGNLLRKFESPVIINLERDKYFACFSIINGCFTRMCHQLETLENDMDIEREHIYLSMKNKLVQFDEQPNRLIYEFFEPHYLPKLLDAEIYPFKAKRKPSNVRDISSDDIENLHATYFNKTSLLKKQESVAKKDEKKVKGKKSKSKEGKKKGKSKELLEGKEASKATVKDSGVRKEISVESFDPYVELFTYISEPIEPTEPAEPLEPTEPVVPPTTEQTKCLSQLEKEDYNYKQYLIVYSCLSNAVDAIVDTLQTFECVVPYPTVNVMKPQFPDSDDAETTKEGG